MSDDFKLGDVVRLKSGGPDMTITEILDDRTNAHCEWFDGQKTPQAKEFSLVSLMHKPPPTPIGRRF